MEIRFSIAKRAATPAEGGKIRLQPRIETRSTTDVVEFQKDKERLSSSLPTGELMNALDVLQRIMLHEMEKGNAVHLPGIGTFRLALKGDIDVKDGYYHGRDVRVAGMNFQPDRKLLSEVRQFNVNQEPYGQAFDTDDDDIEQRLTTLFADHDTVTRKDVRLAFEWSLTPHRVTSLLQRLVREGRLIRIGDGAQTRYRPAPGHFGR